MENKKDAKVLSPIEQYYESIIEKANSLVEQKKLNEALAILEDELDTPYIPKEQEEILEDLANSIMAEMQYFNGLDKYEKMQKEELLEASFLKGNLDKMAFSLYCERYGENFSDEDKKMFEYYLSTKKMKNEDKVFLFLKLIFHKVDNKVLYYNKMLDKEFLLDIQKTKIYNQIELYVESEKIIEDLTIKEPSILKYCNSLLWSIYIYNFPQVPEYDAKNLAYSIFDYMMNSLTGSKTDSNNHIFEYIENIMNHFEKENQEY